VTVTVSPGTRSSGWCNEFRFFRSMKPCERTFIPFTPSRWATRYAESGVLLVLGRTVAVMRGVPEILVSAAAGGVTPKIRYGGPDAGWVLSRA
jgi:hypothetical protein